MPLPVDWSMNLLRVVSDTSVDPAYGEHAGRPTTARGRALRVVTTALATALFTLAAVQTTRARPAAQTERATIIGQVNRAQADNAAKRQQLASTAAEVQKLQNQALGTQGSGQAAALGIASGATPVTGPGVVVVVDDGPTSGGSQAVVVDTDLRQLVNGLWQAGAEAIAVNGHRISSRTAIRSAGSAITVDYVSLNAPYRVEAIGDPRSLPSAFANTQGGLLWTYLQQNYGMRFEVGTAKVLSLPADPGLTVVQATKPS